MAQPSLTIVQPFISPGASAAVTVSFQDTSPSSMVAGLSFAIGGGTIFGTATPFASVSVAQKTITTYGSTFQIIGTSTTGAQTPLYPGQLLSVAVTAPNTTGAGNLEIINIQAVSTNGTPVTVTAAPTVVMCSEYDLNNDCIVNQKDVDAMQQASLGQIPCAGKFAAIGDGKCSIVDVQLIILAVRGVTQ